MSFSCGPSVPAPPFPDAPTPKRFGIISPFFEPTTLIGDCCRLAVVLTCAGLSKLCLHFFNDTRIWGRDRYSQVAFQRPLGQSLLTVTNHRSVLDDPVWPGVLMSFKELSSMSILRWGFCAREVCFKNDAANFFFHAGKAIAVDRGTPYQGINQKAMDLASERLQAGEWCGLCRLRHNGCLCWDACCSIVIVSCCHMTLLLFEINRLTRMHSGFISFPKDVSFNDPNSVGSNGVWASC